MSLDGTEKGGLNRLDRSTLTFTRYRHDPDEPASIGNNFVRSICEDTDGALWIGTYGTGLDRFDPTTGTFTHYRHRMDDTSSLASDRVRSVYVDAGGGISGQRTRRRFQQAHRAGCAGGRGWLGAWLDCGL